jgi:hypothetical protein
LEIRNREEAEARFAKKAKEKDRSKEAKNLTEVDVYRDASEFPKDMTINKVLRPTSFFFFFATPFSSAPKKKTI